MGPADINLINKLPFIVIVFSMPLSEESIWRFKSLFHGDTSAVFVDLIHEDKLDFSECQTTASSRFSTGFSIATSSRGHLRLIMCHFSDEAISKLNYSLCQAQLCVSQTPATEKSNTLLK